MRKRVLVLFLMGLLVAEIIGGVNSATKTSTQPSPKKSLPAPITTEESRSFPGPTDIFVVCPNWGEWAEYYQKGEKPEVVTKTHPTAVFGESITILSEICDGCPSFNLEITHGWGMKHLAYLGPDTIQEIELIDPEELPSLLEASIINIDGETITQFATGRLFQCINNPVWREYLLQATKTSITLGEGTDGFVIDNWHGTYESLKVNYPNDGCYCQYCMQGFREYLRAKYNTEELRDLGIEDIDSFHYGDFIRANYLTLYKESRWEVPLYWDFDDYMMETITDFYRQFIAEIKAHAITQEKEVDFTANTNQLGSIRLPIADDVDFLLPEYVYGYPPDSRSIPTYKLGRSLGTPVCTFPQSNFSQTSDIMTRSDATTLWKIYTAEAYSARGFAFVPYGYDIFWIDPPRKFVGNIDDLAPYYEFIFKNKRYYEGRISTARMAVLYSYPSGRWMYEWFENDFYGICNLLLDTHFQYDVLFSGDDDWMEDKLTLSALQRYEVVVLPDTKHLSDKQVNILLSYVRLGGSIIAFGEIGTHNEKGNYPVERPELESLLTEGSHNFGLGKFVYISDQVGSNYLNTRDASARQQFAEALRGLIYPNIQTTANENMTMLEYWNSKTKSIVLHLINYSYDIDKQQLHPQKDIDLEVLLYEALAGKNLAITYSSPDWKGLARLKYEATEATVKFTIPKLNFYGVVTIGQQGSVIPAMKLLLFDD
jgi:hypothetical protein